MKRLVLAILVMVIMATAIGLAEDGSLIQWTDDQYVVENQEMMLCVLRPRISLYENKSKGKLMDLYSGDILTLLEQDGQWCKVQTEGGQQGYVSTGYIGYVYYKIYLSSHGVSLSHQTGMNENDLGSASGGKRYREEAMVLYEQGDYLYVVTSEGCSGFVYRYDPGIVYN